MGDSKVLCSFYGDPPREFHLYPGCVYKYDGVRCIYIEPLADTETDKDKVSIKFRENETVYPVDKASLSPIPLTVEELDRYSVSTTYSIAEGTKDWKFECELPFTIHYNGAYFVYTNPIIEEKGEAPIPVSYLSDLEAVHNSFMKKV